MARWNPSKNKAVAAINRPQVLSAKIASTFEAELFHAENWNRSMKFLFK